MFLDLETDRYFRLPSGYEDIFRGWAAGLAPHAAEQEEAKLAAVGLLVPASIVAHAPLRPAPPALRDALDETVPRPAKTDVARALAAEIRAELQLRRRPLMDIVRGLQMRATRQALPREREPERAREIASAFATTAILLGSADRCLPRALALLSVCKRRGIHTTLVFGVRLDPFAAHCWVQLGGDVLVGDYEQVRVFTPILAIE